MTSMQSWFEFIALIIMLGDTLSVGRKDGKGDDWLPALICLG